MPIRIGLAVIASTLITAGLGAQANPVPGAACTYDACALRQEGALIRRGISGERVAKMGLFSADNVSAIVRGDSAKAYANLFDRDYRRGSRLTLFGAVVTDVPLMVFLERVRGDRHFVGVDGALIGASLGGLVIGELGSKSLKRARTAASKAIWWHNRELSR